MTRRMLRVILLLCCFTCSLDQVQAVAPITLTQPTSVLMIQYLLDKSVPVPDGVWLRDDRATSYLPDRYRSFWKNPRFKGPSMRISGSAQMNPEQLTHLVYHIRTITQDIKTPIYIVDLRLEPHGFFHNQALRLHNTDFWVAFQRNLAYDYERALFSHLNDMWSKIGQFTLFGHIQKIHAQRLSKQITTFVNIAALLQNKKTELEDDASVQAVSDLLSKLPPTDPRPFKTEEDLCRDLEVHYMRFPVADHHAPTHDVACRFFKWLQTLPKNAWVHFHCAGGRGRTTTFMMLTQMARYKPHLSFEVFSKHHHAAGAIDVHDIQPDSLKAQWGYDRLAFLKAIYQNAQTHGQLLSNCLCL